jgi:hypothetical protein
MIYVFYAGSKQGLGKFVYSKSDSLKSQQLRYDQNNILHLVQ